jgi:hypothetical protein
MKMIWASRTVRPRTGKGETARSDCADHLFEPRLAISILRDGASTLAASLSTQTTSFPFSARQAPATSPTYPVPTTAIFIARSPGGSVGGVASQPTIELVISTTGKGVNC